METSRHIAFDQESDLAEHFLLFEVGDEIEGEADVDN